MPSFITPTFHSRQSFWKLRFIFHESSDSFFTGSTVVGQFFRELAVKGGNIDIDSNCHSTTYAGLTLLHCCGCCSKLSWANPPTPWVGAMLLLLYVCLLSLLQQPHILTQFVVLKVGPRLCELAPAAREGSRNLGPIF